MEGKPLHWEDVYRKAASRDFYESCAMGLGASSGVLKKISAEDSSKIKKFGPAHELVLIRAFQLAQWVCNIRNRACEKGPFYQYCLQSPCVRAMSILRNDIAHHCFEASLEKIFQMLNPKVCAGFWEMAKRMERDIPMCEGKTAQLLRKLDGMFPKGLENGHFVGTKARYEFKSSEEPNFVRSIAKVRNIINGASLKEWIDDEKTRISFFLNALNVCNGIINTGAGSDDLQDKIWDLRNRLIHSPNMNAGLAESVEFFQHQVLGKIESLVRKKHALAKKAARPAFS